MLRVTAICLLLATVYAVEFQIKNSEKGPIWVGIQGNSGQPHLKNGGFELQEGQTKTISGPDDWAGRFWARTWCDNNTKHCLTGDCGNKLQCGGSGGTPPATLVEITLKGSAGQDFYDISLVDGFNIPASIEPVEGRGDCKKTACSRNINNDCPPELSLNTTDHGVVACNSACSVFNTNQYCCRVEHGTPDTCKSSDWPKNYPKFFKDECPDAYSYAYDDINSTFTCQAERYTIIFGI